MSTYSRYPDGYYVYAYLRKSDLTPYYIGKGKNNRAFDPHTFGPPKDKDRVVILFEGLTESVALDLEKRLINLYGRKDNKTGILRNQNDGGFGGDMSSSPAYITGMSKRDITGPKNPRFNVKVTDDTRKKMSLAKKGKIPGNLDAFTQSAKDHNWYYNPITGMQCLIRKGDDIPNGFIKGNIKTSLDNSRNPRKPTPVRCIELGIDFPTLKSAADFVKLKHPRDIVDSIIGRGQRKTAAGYHWQFISGK